MFGLNNLPEITKNLIIINGIMFLALVTFPTLYNYFSLFYFSNELFRPWQFVTHMFSHANFMHLLFNMFALWMFGSVLEQVIGAKRFLIFYLITGFGGAFLHLLVNVIEIYTLSGEFWIPSLDAINALSISYSDKIAIRDIVFTPMVGASGAIFGVLIGFAFFFPNAKLMLIFPPIPVRAKVLVTILIIFELFSGYQRAGNIAHFAHLGGALFGYFILKAWKRRGIL